MQNGPSSSRNLKDHFRQLVDPRVGRAKRHELLDNLLIAVCAMLCGAEGFTEIAECGRCKADWFKTWLALPHGIPSHDTFNRVFGLIDPNKFMDCFLAWTQSLRETFAGELVVLDGKTPWRSRARGPGPIHLVNVWAARNRLVLGQLKVADHSNEITALPACWGVPWRHRRSHLRTVLREQPKVRAVSLMPCERAGPTIFWRNR